MYVLRRHNRQTPRSLTDDDNDDDCAEYTDFDLDNDDDDDEDCCENID